MPQKIEDLPPNCVDIEEECQHIPLKYPWTIACEDGTLVFVITSLQWTFICFFCIRVTAHPEENPNTLKQKNMDKHHPLLQSLSEALNDYVKFPEPHLDSHQLHIFGELLDFWFWEDIIARNGHCSSSLSRLGTG